MMTIAKLCICMFLVGPLVGSDQQTPPNTEWMPNTKMPPVITFNSETIELTIEGAAKVKIIGNEVIVRTPGYRAPKEEKEKRDCTLL